MGTTLTNLNSIQEEIKSRLKSGNACYKFRIFCLQSAIQKFKIKIYRTIILSVVLYGGETCSLTLMEENRLRVFKSRVLRRVLGPERDEIIGECRKLHNKELNDLYSSPNIVPVMKLKRMRWAEHVACMGESRGVYRDLVGKNG